MFDINLKANYLYVFAFLCQICFPRFWSLEILSAGILTNRDFDFRDFDVWDFDFRDLNPNPDKNTSFQNDGLRSTKFLSD